MGVLAWQQNGNVVQIRPMRKITRNIVNTTVSLSEAIPTP